MPAIKGVEIENRTRDVLKIDIVEPVEVEENGAKRTVNRKTGVFVLGDRADTDDKVPPTGRDPELQPSPRVRMPREQYEKLGSFCRSILEERRDAGLLSIQEITIQT